MEEPLFWVLLPFIIALVMIAGNRDRGRKMPHEHRNGDDWLPGERNQAMLMEIRRRRAMSGWDMRTAQSDTQEVIDRYDKENDK